MTFVMKTKRNKQINNQVNQNNFNVFEICEFRFRKILIYFHMDFMACYIHVHNEIADINVNIPNFNFLRVQYLL